MAAGEHRAEAAMSMSQLENGRLSVPEDIRRELDLQEGDQLEAHIVAGGIFIRRTPGSPDDIEQAWDRLFRIIRRPEGKRPSDPPAQEEDIAEEIKGMRSSQ
jgi:AbrB family looped-hinge helix DNA binding protein